MTLEIWKKYSEVHHYTDVKGLRGILESQTLFATRYDHLNDSSELSILRERLPQLLEPVVKKYLLDLQHLGARQRSEIKKSGGVPYLSEKIAKDFSTIHFDAAFAPSGDKPATTTPYIASFCGFKPTATYERENGLLSQWRAYGTEGFALVFDSEKLWKLCLKEQGSYDYGPIMLDDVVYDDDEQNFVTEIGPAIETIKADVDSYLREAPSRTPNKEKVGQVLSSFARVKHRAFKEEHEVRILAAPITAEIRSHMSPQEAALHTLPIKEWFLSATSAAIKHQIRLFDFQHRHHLPIKRIIVGPQREQADALRMVRDLVAGTHIKASVSKTPLIVQA